MTLARRHLLLSAPALAAPLPAMAQGTWPSRPVRIIVPYAAAGGTDLLARAIAEALRPILPQTAAAAAISLARNRGTHNRPPSSACRRRSKNSRNRQFPAAKLKINGKSVKKVKQVSRY